MFREFGTFFPVPSWVDCITNMFGFDLRQAQRIIPDASRTRSACDNGSIDTIPISDDVARSLRFYRVLDNGESRAGHVLMKPRSFVEEESTDQVIDESTNFR